MSECCKRPKNSCMVCKRTVTAKTGLQCQGSCKSWIHYKCCSYTPGKIQDIKAKVIKVRCPCPDCTTQGPKEVLMKDPSFTCANKICPGSQKGCKARKCPTNSDKVVQQPSSCSGMSDNWAGSSGKPCPAQEDPCAQGQQPVDNRYPSDSRPQPFDNSSQAYSDNRSPPFNSRGHPIPVPCPSTICREPSAQVSARSSPTGRRKFSPRISPRTSQTTTPVMPSISIIENMCETVGLLSNQLNFLMVKMTELLTPKGTMGSHGGMPQPCCCPKPNTPMKRKF